MFSKIGSFTPIVEICKREQIHIEESVWQTGNTGEAGHSDCHTFSACHAAFVMAVDIIKHSRGRQKLIDKPLPVAELPDSVSRQLATLLNSTATVAQQVSADFDRPDVSWDIEACGHAERSFVRTIDNLQQGEPTGARIIITDGRAVVLQKLKKIKSGLTLQDMTIGRAQYPAGTLVRLPNELSTSDDNVAVSQSQDVRWLEPIRLTAFAAPAAERADMLRQVFVGTGESAAIMSGWTIETIGDIATRAAASA